MGTLFDAHQRATIESATGRIIPKDRDPGAIEAGVIDYVENALGGYDAEYLPVYIDGVEELDRLAHEMFNAMTFTSLRAREQDQVLARLEKKESPFFVHLLEHTMQGFYGDPCHGGNRHRASWKMIGFPGPAHPHGYQPPFGWYDENILDEYDPGQTQGEDDAEK
ncbi:MAG TPA: gluconate 2-dehydrogenase subunit 3 family protein [Terriglobales bacterium]|nr:gluconate 2-dehydrogenase subunit 3 family protein [Terriglobales bacterium]